MILNTVDGSQLSASTTIIVQARCGSTRLPNKVLLDLHGKKLIEWIYWRLSRCKLATHLIFAVPQGEQDDPLCEALCQIGAKFIRGSEEDVLARFFKAANSVRSDWVVRVCADNPLVSPTCIDELIYFFYKNPCDYAYNHIPKENLYPDGFGAEIVSFSTLEMINHLAKERAEREHIFNYIWAHPNRFQIRTFDPPDPALRHPEIRLDIDTQEDLDFFLSTNLRPEMTDYEIIDTLLKSSEISRERK